MKRFMNSLVRAVARLPFWMLYAIADCIFFLVYYVVRYRRRLVDKNLSDSFPQWSAHTRHHVARKFYRNFADYIVETIKLLHISDDEMKRRFVFEGVEIIDERLRQNRSVAAYFSHSFNWEWAPSFTLWSTLKVWKQGEAAVDSAAFCQIYRPLKSEWFDHLMLQARSRFGAISIPKAHTLRRLLQLRKDSIPYVTGFMADQKPSHGDPTYVTTFLNHPTAMITGTETLARRLGLSAVYWDMSKLGRGKYKVTVRLIGDDLDALPPMQVTDTYARMLEESIRREPDLWLWSHNRWKYPVKTNANA